MKLSADTITDTQIRELLSSTTEPSVRRLCKVALDDAPTYLRTTVVRTARHRVAEILNARSKS